MRLDAVCLALVGTEDLRKAQGNGDQGHGQKGPKGSQAGGIESAVSERMKLTGVYSREYSQYPVASYYKGLTAPWPFRPSPWAGGPSDRSGTRRRGSRSPTCA